MRSEQGLTPNPFLIEPKPSIKDKSFTQEANEEIYNKSEDGEKEFFNPSPFNMKPW
ncbi:hypothetical protein [Legionella israelensis]|uniref:hypothetical protein n=1 Tax=Legionella israelensis TaxID=454 RepID=UPI001FD1B68F|nr:hypothetical protein [Legionella israelensis]